MKTIQQFLNTANQTLVTIDPEDTVFHALTLLAKHCLSALPVVRDGKLVGIISERDYARKVVLKDKSSKETQVQEIMTAGVITMRLENRIDDCMAIMSSKHIRHLPIVNAENGLIGIVSIGDVVNQVIEEQRSMIDELHRYISG